MYCYKNIADIKGNVIRLNGLCPYWIATNHGTIKCEYLNVEQIPENSKESYEIALEYFGSEEELEKNIDNGLMWDQVKDCGVNI